MHSIKKPKTTHLHRSFRHLALIIAIIFTPIQASCLEPVYIDSLVRKASSLKLHEERAWRALLHYGRVFTGGYRSKIDDKKFFTVNRL